MHIPIGIANTLDSLKTFVEAEGNFSPGVGTYGIYFWLYDRAAERLFAPTMKDVSCEHGLAQGGWLIPWSKWNAGDVVVRSELCHVLRDSPAGRVHVVGARVDTEKYRGRTQSRVAVCGPASARTRRIRRAQHERR